MLKRLKAAQKKIYKNKKIYKIHTEKKSYSLLLRIVLSVLMIVKHSAKKWTRFTVFIKTKLNDMWRKPQVLITRYFEIALGKSDVTRGSAIFVFARHDQWNTNSSDILKQCPI